jgi:hypothetical protein
VIAVNESSTSIEDVKANSNRERRRKEELEFFQVFFFP